MKKWAPSARQKRCVGLARGTYPAYLRDLVDYDYDKGLPDAARQWLAAFTEEHYRGWRLKAEQQVTPVEAIRSAKADCERIRRRALSGGLEKPRMGPEPSTAREVQGAMAHALDRRRRG